MSKLPGVDEHQPAPIKNENRAIQDLVIEDLQTWVSNARWRVIGDIQARKEVGLQRYGTLLQAYNGRDALMDAYQEALDLAQYLKQAIVEGDLRMMVLYNDSLRIACHLRNAIEDRNERTPATLGDPGRPE